MQISAEQWGRQNNSCREAMDQRRALGPDKSQSDWWLACNRGDWLIWQLQRLPREELKAVLPALLRALDKITYRAVENTAAAQALLAVTGDEIPEVLEWAKGWLSGQDRSESAAESAESAARSAARSAAASAARSAAWSARSAAWSAAESVESAAWSVAWSAAESARSARSAAWSAELQQQADDIRAEIPTWPGKLI